MDLHSIIIGTGSPLVILHGFLGMSDNWKTLGTKFSKLGYEVHLIDQRNHGRSPHSDDFSYKYLSNDLLNYCNTHQLKNIILLGHSMGGKTAMLFACENPHLVSKLIIADISPKYYAPHHQDILDSLNALDFSEIKSRTNAEEALKPFIPDLGVRLFLLKNVYRISSNEFGLRINLPILTEKNIEIGQALPQKALFSKTVLFLKGEKSNYITNEDTAILKHHFPKFKITTISKSGHWLHAENPIDFFNTCKEYFEEK